MTKKVLILLALLPMAAWAQDPTPPAPANPPGSTTPTPNAPANPPGAETISPGRLNQSTASGVAMNGEMDLYQLLTWSAQKHRKNFIISDKKELQGKKVTFISHRNVTGGAAWEAFLSALEVHGFTLTTAGPTTYKVVKSTEASQTPIRVNTNANQLYGSDQVVTQLLQLKNISVNDISKVITTLAPPEAKIVAYAPTNTLIITDTAHNLRKIVKVAQQLDVEAPTAKLEIIKLRYAEAAEVKGIIEELYGTAETSDPSDSARSSRRAGGRRSSTRRNRRGGRNRDPEPTQTESVSAGKASKYIDKILDDERTNALIVLANDQGMTAVKDLVNKLDVDITPRSQIHVVYLEHAKAEDVSKVLADLAQSASGVGQQARGGRNNSRRNQPATPARGRTAARPGAAGAAAGGGDEESGGAIAAFEDMHITADENTNSLIILAAPDAFTTIKGVIDRLDIVRKQVFVDAVIMELSSEDSNELGLGYHTPVRPGDGGVGIVGGTFGQSSIGGPTSIANFDIATGSADLLSGLAVGVFGESIDVDLGNGTTLGVPAFGIALNALKSNSSVNIVSNPNLLTLDNEEAKIVVGRKIPFPTSQGLSSLGQPIISFQREDVAITLKVTPRVNSSNFVTLELQVEVQEIEEDDRGLDVQQSGFITSKREIETVALVRDNQTVVLGGLMGTTDTEVETKVPVLGDLPLLGVLFRGTRKQSRKSNLMVFLTPHIVDDEEDMFEIQRIKEAQRREFLRRFYGKSRDQQMAEMNRLLRYSMNHVDQPSLFRGPSTVSNHLLLDGTPVSDETRDRIQQELDAAEPPPAEEQIIPDDPQEEEE